MLAWSGAGRRLGLGSRSRPGLGQGQGQDQGHARLRPEHTAAAVLSHLIEGASGGLLGVCVQHAKHDALRGVLLIAERIALLLPPSLHLLLHALPGCSGDEQEMLRVWSGD